MSVTDRLRGVAELRMEDHPLPGKTLDKLRPMIDSIATEDLAIQSSKERLSKAPKLSEEQSYHHYVFWYASNMLKAFARVNQAIIYIRDFPKPRAYLKQGITEYDWIQHHYHVYMVSSFGLYDIALKLTNGVFRLGVDERRVNRSTVEDNSWVRATGVSDLLQTLRQATSQFKDPRNLHIHGGDLLKLDELDRLDIVCMARKLDATCEYGVDSIRSLLQSDIDELVNEMSGQVSSLENSVIALFDMLLPIHSFWASYFRTKLDSE